MNVRFFVTGHGRSGTHWLTSLLNESDPTVAVHHESLSGFDKGRYWRGSCVDYLAERERHMERVSARDKQGLDWAECNSYLRYCVPGLRERFGVPVALLVRDGRYVVRSLLACGCYQIPYYPEVPAPDGLETAFEKCCWYWANTYRAQDAPVWRLEDLNEDYMTFERLCDYLDTDPDRDVWTEHAGRPANVGVDDPRLPAWGEEQTATFERLAGDVQKQFYQDRR